MCAAFECSALNNNLRAQFEFFGISPWEIQIAHEYFGKVFEIEESAIESPTSNSQSYVRIVLPVLFSDEFFRWFGFKNWEKIKFLFKEMKRRRGGRGRGILIRLEFDADPHVSFIIDSESGSEFGNSVEKLDYVLEVIDNHLKDLPTQTSLVYRFSKTTHRWTPFTSEQEN